MYCKGIHSGGTTLCWDAKGVRMNDSALLHAPEAKTDVCLILYDIMRSASRASDTL